MAPKLARGLVLGGAFLMILTAAAHFFWGYPALQSAIAKGAITSAPEMKTEELRGVWIILSVNLLLLGLFLILRVWQNRLDHQLAVALGLVPLTAGLIMAGFVQGFHPAVPLLILPGVCLVAGGLLLSSR